MVTRHNCIRDCIADFCRRAHLSPLLEQGCGIGPAKDRSRPADILIPNWSLSRSAAFDIKVIHSLNNSLISDAGQTSGASAAVGEQEKLENNALGCLERGWICVPLIVEAYGGWGISGVVATCWLGGHLHILVPPPPPLEAHFNARISQYYNTCTVYVTIHALTERLNGRLRC